MYWMWGLPLTLPKALDLIAKEPLMRPRLSGLGAAALLAVAALACPNPAAAQGQELKKLHALLVIDTNAKVIGESVRVDLGTMRDLLGLLPKDKVEITVLQGADVAPTRVLDYFKRLQTGSDEAILCYYAG